MNDPALVAGMTVSEERMLSNLELTHGALFSQSVLLALVASGLERDDAYRIVQSCARRALEERRNFREVVESDDAVTLSNDALEKAFDAQRLLHHRRRFLDALSWAP